MTSIPVQTERFTALTDDERQLVQFSLQQTAKRIMDRAAANEYGPDDLVEAAATFHMASALSGEIGVTLGDPPLSAESLEMVAVCIAEGDAPFASRMAAEVEAPPEACDDCDLNSGHGGDHEFFSGSGSLAPLGDQADVPVTEEEFS